MKIIITQLSEDEIISKRIKSWPIWTCAKSEFSWEYEETESCYLLEGEVEVISAFETVRFSSGDFSINLHSPAEIGRCATGFWGGIFFAEQGKLQ